MSIIDSFKEHLTILFCLIAVLFAWNFSEVLGIESTLGESIFIELIVVLLLVIFALIMLFCIEINLDEGKSKYIELNRYKVDHRTHDFCVIVESNIKFRIMKILFYLLANENELKSLFLQIYWKPKEALQIAPHENYPSLAFVDGYPSIFLSCLVPNQLNKYRLKLSCTPKHPESASIELKIRKYCTSSVGIKCKILFLLINTKHSKKEILISNKLEETT